MLESVSSLLGYVSIGCWLGAQFPQVLENYKRQSCQGLAWPFLLNWLLGDASNLIGCILTNQLPFQTWLAVYFVFVDCSLVGQYIYYESRRPAPAFGRGRRRTISRARSSSRYRSLSHAAANVVSAVSHGDVRHVPRTPRRLSVEVGDHSIDHHHTEDDAFNTASALSDSFQSDTGNRPDPARRISWSIERPALGASGHLSRSAMLSRSSIPSVIHLTATESPDGEADRGRTIRRDVEVIPESTTSQGDGTVGRGSRHATRTASSVMFVGAWMLFGMGTIARKLSQPSHSGIVLRAEVVTLEDPQSTEKVIGRFFAWLCTTLYLTSRLPQIWKNFVRKSVEGLSMSLFLFAFLGNTFYVASILSSPNMHGDPAEASAFLRESIPFLLGSAGTLMFDVTILTQSSIYKRPKRHHDRSSSIRTRLTQEEEQGLLSGQA
ncbi:PQ loop repeat-domain-containing protein [Flagelloscypha sp. PMI_526]|nr:PQ loop repeat-domain-containing protein [Flagelloscypha sp. PMI_526]